MTRGCRFVTPLAEPTVVGIAANVASYEHQRSFRDAIRIAQLFLSLALALLWTSIADAHNTVITRQIANAPGWVTGTGYKSNYQAVQDATIAAGSGCANGDIVTLSGGTGTAAKLQIAVSGGSMSVSAVGPAGTYSSVPSNPVTATGGSWKRTTSR